MPSAAALDEIERAFTARGAPVQIELAHLVDPAIGAFLTERGYRLVSFENVLGLALTGGPERVMPAGVEVRPSGDDEFEPWLNVVADGFTHPDTQGVPSHEEFSPEVIARTMRDLVAAAGVKRYVGLRDGVIAGGASSRIAEGVAQLTGAATAPAHRRRGVQTALLSTRLANRQRLTAVAVLGEREARLSAVQRLARSDQCPGARRLRTVGGTGRDRRVSGCSPKRVASQRI